MRGGKQILLAWLLLGFIFVSCVKDPKDIPSGIVNDSDFGMTATFGNETVEIAAGTDFWTMLPVVLKQDSLDVYTAVLSLNGCVEQCSPFWSFRFFQAIPDQGDAALDFANTIGAGEKDLVLADSELDSISVRLSTHPGLFMSGYSYWQELSGPASFFHEYETVLAYQDKLDVCFQSFAFTGCHYSQCIYYNPSTQVPCLASIEARLESPNYVSLSVRPTGTPPFRYEWFTEANTPSIVIFIQDSIAEIYAGVSVIDSLGNRTQLSQTIRVQNGIVDACYFPIELTSEIVKNTSPSIYADQLEVVYTDQHGAVWRSTGGIQPQESKVTIDAISSYGLSPFNQPSSLVDLTAKCMLYNEVTGEGKLFESTRLTIALSHP